MSASDTPSPQDQLNEMWINLRNELIVQAANVYIVGRQAALASVGLVALSADEAQAIARQAFERGEIAESDAQAAAQAVVDRIQQRAAAIDETRVELTEKAGIALEENVKTILNAVRLPGSKAIEDTVSRLVASVRPPGTPLRPARRRPARRTSSRTGMLYLVATPIGNLGDITLRALETLRAVDFVASEDTRLTGRLLKHFDISKPQIAFHEHNEAQAGERILGLLRTGASVALVTDAGTPGISDPGYSIVRRAIAAGLPLTMIPGPTGLIMAVVLSGLPLHSFTFRGFPPRKQAARRRFLAVDQDSPHTLIFYESPFRLADFLADALAVYGDRPAALANDLTKLYEKMDRGTLASLLEGSQGRRSSRGSMWW